MKKTNQSPLEVIEENAPDTRTYVGGLLMFLPVVPIVATIISIAAYVGSNLKASGTSPGWLDALVGTISTLLLWFLLAFFCRRFTMVRRANEKSYYSLLNHLSTLDYYIDALLSDDTKKATLDMLHNARIKKPGTKFRWLPFVRSSEALPNQPPTPGPSGVPQNQPPSKDISALDPKQEVLYYRNALYLALMQRSASWVVGNGYIELWDLMDSAEEALITFVPPAKVISDAVYDEMRLNNSKIENSEEWTNKLGSAVKKLDTDAVRYLKPSVGTQSLTEGAGIQQQAPQATEDSPSVTSQGRDTDTSQQAEARAILRKVREMINDFNTESWGALISARNQLFCTMILVGLTMFVFVALAIIFQANPRHLEVATFFAFIGGLSGLIGRLSIESQIDKTIDDYRLSMARLLVTPLLSGLAAVIGVLIVTKAPTSLDDIYSFKAAIILPNLIIAATFGLTPNLLINRLQKKSEGYKENLQSTQPTSGK